MAGLSESLGAVRAWRYRDRRRRGCLCIAHVEIGDADIAALVAAGMLDMANASDPAAIEAGLGAVLDDLAQRVMARW
jgi:Pyruvate/2-oxoacid:ferredoxin oxidoreductase gamma subunit